MTHEDRFDAALPVAMQRRSSTGQSVKHRETSATATVPGVTTTCPIGQGNRRGYKRGCRCDECRRDAMAHQRIQRGIKRYREIDPIAVERCTAGLIDPHSLTLAERREVVRRLHRHGLSDPEIARRTGMCARTVLRHRQRLGLARVTS